MILFSHTSRAKPEKHDNDGIYTAQESLFLCFPSGEFPFNRSTYFSAYGLGMSKYVYLGDQATVFGSNPGPDRVIKKLL
jgi:hypothetical protein